MPPITVMIKPVSSMCNMRCRYCFYSDVANHRKVECLGRMEDSTLETLVRRAMRYADGSVSFAFQGGEPTLAGAAFYRKLLEYERMYNTKKLRVSNALQTNGYDLSDELLDVFAEAGFLIGVSFDGTPEIHDQLRVDANGIGTSARVLDTIRRLKQRNIQFNILCVVNDYIAKDPEAVFDSLSQYGFIQYIPCLDGFDGSRQPWSLSEENYASFLMCSFDKYYTAFKSGRFVSVRDFDNYIGIILGQEPESCGMCGRCAQYWLAEADGSVYPCDFYVLDEWRIGSILDSSFFAFARSAVQQEFMSASLYVDEKCRECRWYGLCRGGCRRDREPFSNGRPLLNKHCASFRAFFEYAYPRMKEMAEDIAKSGK